MPIAVLAQGAAALPLCSWVGRHCKRHLGFQAGGLSFMSQPLFHEWPFMLSERRCVGTCYACEFPCHGPEEHEGDCCCPWHMPWGCGWSHVLPEGIERRSPPSPRTPRTHPSPHAPPPHPRLSVAMRWAVSGEVLGTKSFRLDWPVYAIRSQAAATIAEAGSGCTPLDVQIMCNGEILLGHTLIQDVDFGPQPEVTVVRVNKIALQGAGS